MLIYTRRDHMGRDYPDPPQPTGEIVNDINNAILGVITDYESGIEARKEQLTQIRELYKVVTENIYQPYDEVCSACMCVRVGCVWRARVCTRVCARHSFMS